MKKIILVVVGVGVFVVGFGLIKNNQMLKPVTSSVDQIGNTVSVIKPPPIQPAPNRPTISRSFLLGFLPIPAQPLSTENWLAAFDLFKTSSEVVMHHVHFDAGNIESVKFIAGMTDRVRLKKFLVVDSHSSDHLSLDPDLANLGSNFGNTKVRTAFKNLAVTLVRNFNPAYLS